MEEKKYLNSLIENLSGTSDAANEFFSQIIEKYGTNKNSPKDDIELVDSIDKYILQESKKITPKKTKEKTIKLALLTLAILLYCSSMFLQLNLLLKPRI